MLQIDYFGQEIDSSTNQYQIVLPSVVSTEEQTASSRASKSVWVVITSEDIKSLILPQRKKSNSIRLGVCGGGNRTKFT
ncbi:hypothetical protein TNCV_2847851 [Trichonephila clavipes]|nr:hypothetical protein TNCV_2847851 [Trichonephila clavipes]